MKPILSIENLSKSYQIRSADQPRYQSLRDLLSFSQLLRKQKTEIVWALKDLSFEAQPGERIAIIGKNGAGKSTLLKILSRITQPTAGRAVLRGRVASLLEVGTGFHPELTGRENIYLNGAVLGLKRHEIKAKFDEIVEFSGVGQFLETPLKFYSSGMQLRLAFSVAAFLEPEILLLDEVLAVGDAEFQKKGLQKMGEVAESGRTILFISHNMAAVRQLCTRGVVLEKGELVFDGPVELAVGQYLNKEKEVASAVWLNEIDQNPTIAFLKKIVVSDIYNYPKTDFLSSEPIKVAFHVSAFTDVSRFTIGFDIFRDGVHLFRSRQIDGMAVSDIAKNNEYIFTCMLPEWFLHEGNYYLRPFMAIHFIEHLSRVFNNVEMVIEIQTDPSRSPLHGSLDSQGQPGLIFPMFKWEVFSKKS